MNDAKRILDLNNITKVVIKGGSWGSTLALLFSEKYPKMIKKIIITDIFFATKEDDEWGFGYTGKMYPDMREKMIKDIPNDKNIAEYYLKLILSNRKTNLIKAMNDFGKYEYSIGSLDVKIDNKVNLEKVNNTKIFLHYMKNNYFLRNNEIMKNIKSIQNKPCLIIHNRLDLLCPLESAWNLHKTMKKSKLIIQPFLGHGVFRKEAMKKIKKEITQFLEE